MEGGSEEEQMMMGKRYVVWMRMLVLFSRNVADTLLLPAANRSVRDGRSRPEAQLSRDDSCMMHARHGHVICPMS